MKLSIFFIFLVFSFSSFSKCIEYSPYAGGVDGIFSWCTGDEVHIATKDYPTTYDKKGLVTDVEMTKLDDWFNTIQSIKITVKLYNGKEVVVGSHSSYKTTGCQLYSTSDGWSSRIFCVGDRVEIPTHYNGTNRPTGDKIKATILAVGFVQAVVQFEENGEISTVGSFVE